MAGFSLDLPLAAVSPLAVDGRQLPDVILHPLTATTALPSLRRKNSAQLSVS
jgi:hypothetical protein